VSGNDVRPVRERAADHAIAFALGAGGLAIVAFVASLAAFSAGAVTRGAFLAAAAASIVGYGASVSLGGWAQRAATDAAPIASGERSERPARSARAVPSRGPRARRPRRRERARVLRSR
jgi:predicted phage tail protein